MRGEKKMLRSLRHRGAFCWLSTQYVNLFYFETKWIGIVCKRQQGMVRRAKNKTKTKLVYLYLFLIVFICAPLAQFHSLYFIIAHKSHKTWEEIQPKRPGYKKSIRVNLNIEDGWKLFNAKQECNVVRVHATEVFCSPLLRIKNCCHCE